MESNTQKIAQFLTAKRKEKGISTYSIQKDGLNISSLSRIEKGENVKFENVLKFIKLLHLTNQEKTKLALLLP